MLRIRLLGNRWEGGSGPQPLSQENQNGYFWALARDDRPWSGDDTPAVAFIYAPGRADEYAKQSLGVSLARCKLMAMSEMPRTCERRAAYT